MDGTSLHIHDIDRRIAGTFHCLVTSSDGQELKSGDVVVGEKRAHLPCDPDNHYSPKLHLSPELRPFCSSSFPPHLPPPSPPPSPSLPPSLAPHISHPIPPSLASPLSPPLPLHLPVIFQTYIPSPPCVELKALYSL